MNTQQAKSEAHRDTNGFVLRKTQKKDNIVQKEIKTRGKTMKKQLRDSYNRFKDRG